MTPNDLLDPGAYPGPRADSVSLRTTHLSWVFLTPAEAWKIKRPVDYGFADYSTLERREHFCREEVRLNRRLAPEVYPLAWLVGRWRGPGVVGYPGIDETTFVQEVEFDHDGGPYLRYSSTIRLDVTPDDAAALTMPTPYRRPGCMSSTRSRLRAAEAAKSTA